MTINKPKPPMNKSPYLLIFASFFTLISCSTSTTPINYGEKYFVENIDKSRGCGDCDEFWVMEFNGPETGVIYSTPNPFDDLKSCSREFSYERRGKEDFIIHVLEDTVLRLSNEAFRNSKNYYLNTCEDEIFGNTYTLGDGLVNVKHYGYISANYLYLYHNITFAESLEAGSLYGIPINIGESLPKTKLRIKRNEIFARKGYKFNSVDLTEHFSTKSWYKPTGKNVKLSEREKHIVNSIKKLEELDLAVYDIQKSSNDTIVFLNNPEGTTLYWIYDNQLFTLPLYYNLVGDLYPYLTDKGKVKLSSNNIIFLENLGCVLDFEISDADGSYYQGAQVGDLLIFNSLLDTNKFIELGPGLGLSSLYDNIIEVSRILDKNYGLYARRTSELTYDCEDCTTKMSETSYFNYSNSGGLYSGYSNDGYSTFRKSSRSSYKGVSKVEQKFLAACYAGNTRIATIGGSKQVKDIIKGDSILTSSGPIQIDSVVSVVHDNLLKIKFDNNKELILTPDHPLVAYDGINVSFNPHATIQLYDNIAACDTITRNTLFEDINGNQIKISKIEPFIGQHETYTIFSKEKFIYYINGIPTIPEFFASRSTHHNLNT